MIADDFPAIAWRLKSLSAELRISDEFLPLGWLLWKPIEKDLKPWA